MTLASPRRLVALTLVVTAVAAAVVVAHQPNRSQAASAACTHPANNSLVTSLPGYHVWLFAASQANSKTTAFKPDSVVVDGANVYIGWQNSTAKDGSDNAYSTIGEYDLCGHLKKTFQDLGHNDGLRMDPYTHVLWAMSDEDGNPHLTTINPTTGATKLYKFAATSWGGGYDDIQFLGGKAYIDGSNPTLNAAGNNVFPSVFQATLSGSVVKTLPIVKGYPHTTAASVALPITQAPLNVIDADSMQITPTGDLMVDNQAGNQEIFIHDPGPHQTITQLAVGGTIDDTVFASSTRGCILVADNNAGVYAVCSNVFVPGAAFSSAPNDSGVAAYVGTLNMSTGIVIPIIVGLSDGHGMAFVPNMS